MREKVIDVDITKLSREPDIVFNTLTTERLGFNTIKIWVDENIICIYDEWQGRGVYRRTIRSGDDKEDYTGIAFIGKVAANKNKRYPKEWVELANSYLDSILLD